MRDHQRSARVARQRGIAAVLLALFVVVGGAGTALAAGAIQDDASMLSASARASAESKSAQIQRDTGKTVAVKSVPNLGGKDISTVADQYFQQQKLNGVLLYLARDDKKFKITIGANTRQAISTSEEAAIRDQMTQRFAANDFDGGVLNAMDRIGADLRTAAPARTGQTQPATAPAVKSNSRFPTLLIVLIAVAVVAAVLMMVLRRNRGSGTPSGPIGGTNYGLQGGYPPQGGYGPGYGQPSGGNIGGSILGGAVGGIGGAIIGNAVYDHFRDHNDQQGQNSDDRGSVGDYGASGDDRGVVSDAPQDVGDWGSGGSDPGTGDWGSSDSSGGDPGSN
ncbi:MAG: TPM domain-containing protein [Thermomicrobiales bacterium]